MEMPERGGQTQRQLRGVVWRQPLAARQLRAQRVRDVRMRRRPFRVPRFAFRARVGQFHHVVEGSGLVVASHVQHLHETVVRA